MLHLELAMVDKVTDPQLWQRAHAPSQCQKVLQILGRLQELERDDFLFKKGMYWGKPNFDQLLEYMRHVYERDIRHMDHEHTKKLVGRENILQEFVLNVIGSENNKSDEDSTTH